MVSWPRASIKLNFPLCELQFPVVVIQVRAFHQQLLVGSCTYHTTDLFYASKNTPAVSPKNFYTSKFVTSCAWANPSQYSFKRSGYSCVAHGMRPPSIMGNVSRSSPPSLRFRVSWSDDACISATVGHHISKSAFLFRRTTRKITSILNFSQMKTVDSITPKMKHILQMGYRLLM